MKKENIGKSSIWFVFYESLVTHWKKTKSKHKNSKKENVPLLRCALWFLDDLTMASKNYCHRYPFFE